MNSCTVCHHGNRPEGASRMSAGSALWSTMDESSKEDKEAAGVVRH